MPKLVVWVVVLAVGVTGYLIGTRVRAVEDTAKRAKKKLRRR